MYLKPIKKLVKKYTVHLIIIFFLANTSIALLIFSMAQSEPCMNQSQIDTDARCLYVYQNEVYEMGTRLKPHKGHQCGINVDSIMPNLHFAGKILTKFNNTKVAPFCNSQPNPTNTPTQAPTQEPTNTPTATSTPVPTTTATAISTATAASTATPKSTQTPQSTHTSTATPTSTTTPTQTSVTYTGNTFGEILGKPKIATVVPTPLTKTESREFNLTKISKPLTYVSLLGFIGSIILILIF